MAIGEKEHVGALDGCGAFMIDGLDRWNWLVVGTVGNQGMQWIDGLVGCGWPDLENEEEGGDFNWWFGSGGDPKEEETVGWRRRRMGQIPRS